MEPRHKSLRNTFRNKNALQTIKPLSIRRLKPAEFRGLSLKTGKNMPLPSAPTKPGSIVKDIPAQLEIKQENQKEKERLRPRAL